MKFCLEILQKSNDILIFVEGLDLSSPPLDFFYVLQGGFDESNPYRKEKRDKLLLFYSLISWSCSKVA